VTAQVNFDDTFHVADVDRLFQLPLSEFTSARNAMAAALKKSGKRDEAERVKALPKPSVSAWAVNQLFWRHRKVLDRLMAGGADLRNAQAAQLAGKSADIRRPLDARREALAELSRLASAALREVDHQPTPDMMRRITTTLEALSTYGTSPEAPPLGRLIDEVEPPGFETLRALVPRTGASDAKRAGAPSSVIPFRARTKKGEARGRTGSAPDDKARARERDAQRAAAKQAVQEAERSLRDVRRAAERAEGALKDAARRVKEAEAAKADAEARLERADAALASARQQARSVAAEAEDAAQAVTDAERAVERARQMVAAADAGS
jgi:hypothetical protein